MILLTHFSKYLKEKSKKIKSKESKEIKKESKIKQMNNLLKELLKNLLIILLLISLIVLSIVIFSLLENITNCSNGDIIEYFSYIGFLTTFNFINILIMYQQFFQYCKRNKLFNSKRYQNYLLILMFIPMISFFISVFVFKKCMSISFVVTLILFDHIISFAIIIICEIVFKCCLNTTTEEQTNQENFVSRLSSMSSVSTSS